MNISALYNYNNDKSSEEYRNIIDSVATSLLYIIGHYFSSWSNYFVLTLCCGNHHTCNLYNDLFHIMSSKWKEWPFQIVVTNTNDNKVLLEAHQYNIIFTDSYDSLLKMELHTYTAQYDKNEYYFIYLQTRDHLAEVEMKKIFEYCWQHYIINCVIQVQKADGRILIFTYFPFTETFCGHVETVLVNEYNGTALLYEELFPKKLKNFYGCPLRAVLFNAPPFVHLSIDSNNVSYISGGFEGKLLLELSKKLNFSLNVIVESNDSHEKTTNSSITSALKMVKDRQADISLGSNRQTRERMMLLTSTMHYYQTFWSIITLSEAYILTSLETLMFPFTSHTWYLLAFVMTFVLSSIALLRLKLPKHLVKHLNHVSLDLLSIALGMPAFVKPVFHTSRVLKATWIVFALVLRTIYQALLFHLIRAHVIRNMPQTLKELVKLNYTLIADEYTHGGLQNIPLLSKINFIVLNTTDDGQTPLAYLENLPINHARRMSVALPVIRLQYYIQKNKRLNVFKVLPQNILHVNLCMYLSKHSFLVEQFNEVLEMIKGFGILQAWINQEIDGNYIKNTNSDVNQMFDLKQLKVAFILLFVGYAISVVVFITEYVYERVKNCRCLK